MPRGVVEYVQLMGLLSAQRYYHLRNEFQHKIDGIETTPTYGEMNPRPTLSPRDDKYVVDMTVSLCMMLNISCVLGKYNVRPGDGLRYGSRP